MTSDDVELRARCERYRKEREAALDEVDFLRKQLHKSRHVDVNGEKTGKNRILSVALITRGVPKVRAFGYFQKE